MMSKPFFIISVGFFFLIVSCAKQNLRNAEASLLGTWNVTQVFTTTNSSDFLTETGDLGQFQFTENSLEYSYIRRDTLQTGNENWELLRTKENQGFSRVEVYTLELDDLSFRVAFGDETIDAEQDATEMSLTVRDIEGYETVMLRLEKE